MSRSTISMLIAAVVVAWPVAAHAQPSAGPLASAIATGQTLTVRDDAGRQTKGRLLAITADSLTLEVPEHRAPSGRLTIPVPSITQVVHHDGHLNGYLLGLGAGIATAVGFVRYHCGPPGFDKECSVNATLVSLVFIPAGAGLGALTDALITRTVYRAGAATFTVHPQLGRGRKGLTVALRF